MEDEVSLRRNTILHLAAERYYKDPDALARFRKKEKRFADSYFEGELKAVEYLALINGLLKEDGKRAVKEKYATSDALWKIAPEEEAKRVMIKAKSEERLYRKIKDNPSYKTELQELKELNASMKEKLYSGSIDIEGYLSCVNRWLKDYGFSMIDAQKKRRAKPGGGAILYPGMTIGDLTIIKRQIVRGRPKGWLCRCNICGEESYFSSEMVLRGKATDIRFRGGAPCRCENRRLKKEERLAKEQRGYYPGNFYFDAFGKHREIKGLPEDPIEAYKSAHENKKGRLKEKAYFVLQKYYKENISGEQLGALENTTRQNISFIKNNAIKRMKKYWPELNR